MKKLLFLFSVVMLLFAATSCHHQKQTKEEPVKTVFSNTADKYQTAAVVEIDAPITLTQDSDQNSSSENTASEQSSSIIAILSAHWLEILAALMVVAKMITNLTPTKKDNKWFTRIDELINKIFPNYKSGGGLHT